VCGNQLLNEWKKIACMARVLGMAYMVEVARKVK